MCPHALDTWEARRNDTFHIFSHPYPSPLLVPQPQLLTSWEWFFPSRTMLGLVAATNTVTCLGVDLPSGHETHKLKNSYSQDQKNYFKEDSKPHVKLQTHPPWENPGSYKDGNLSLLGPYSLAGWVSANEGPSASENNGKGAGWVDGWVAPSSFVTEK